MAGTLENYSVPCELTFLLRKIENWIFFSVLASFYLPCAQNILILVHIPSASKTESSASCPQHGKAGGPRG